MNKKPKVMLHYVKEKLPKGPNIQFDRMENLELLCGKYDFIHLDQDRIPKEVGNIGVIKYLYQKIKVENPEIIHIQGIKVGFHCMIAAFLAGVRNRILITRGFAGFVEDQPFFKKFFFRYLIEPFTIILATKVQCNSNYSMNMRMIRFLAKRKSVQIYNIHPKIDESIKHQNWRHKYGIESDDFLFVSVARLTYDKGFSYLAEAIKMVSGLNKIKFIVIGDGDYKKKFENDLKNEIAEKIVIITGTLKNQEVLEFISEANVFLLPSNEFETFGGVYLEASLVSVPSIACDIGALNEVIQNNKSGILIKPKNAVEIKEAILKFYESPNLAKHFGEYAHEMSVNKFSHNRIEKQIAELYEGVLKR